ncbi:emerin (Emery-Dreifuss muscular dystrophy) [Micropterus dolomieu]|uniref:emerin (Emery-Dreifuss muscular dystrophy) n=1 Tax=Micropterus dolomieu TaxID=147949 RepID=UPI001E8E9960|nr:emerin (Emery-Dreifuss muscular dystrophy) [Micropterus dolomieu]XP_045913376.1 emerin (Emery-Dreifuss muscular dystrophy) [Micropterus dolomieu]
MSLSEKSNAELGKLLTEYGIKHGPIVESTRRLYEKKLETAMEKAVVKPSPDKTYYREEVEEITYITYQSPVRREVHWGMVKQRGNAGTNEDESERVVEPPIQSTNNTANHSTVQSKEPVRKSGGRVWRVIWLLLLLAVLAAVFYYYAYCQVINQEETGENAENPSGIE